MTRSPVFSFQYLAKGLVVILVELAGHIVGDIEEFHFMTGRRHPGSLALNHGRWTGILQNGSISASGCRTLGKLDAARLRESA